jgi:spermidine synthase
MFLLSFATVLFTLSVWKLLSFFIMPSLFFDLLFIGFPIGAFIGVKFFETSARSFRRTLWILQGVVACSITASLACKHFDYLRAHLFEVRLGWLLGQMGTFTAIFIPFFCAYGLSEYVGYQVGRAVLKGRMRLVYALYLFGAAGAYFFHQLTLSRIGVTGEILLSVLLIAVASLLLAERRAEHWVLAIECAVLLAVSAVPGLPVLEDGFLHVYKGSSEQSTKWYAEKDYRMEFQRWGRYSLTAIMYSAAERQFAGFYNDYMQWEYSPGSGFRERMLGAIPMLNAPEGGRIAIIGAGGGRQVIFALQPRFRFEKIVAIEVEPAVFEAIRQGPLRERFDSVYEAPNVVAVRSEARGYMESTSERFDLIFLPSVGGYPQMMLEPGNMIRTADAYRTMRDRLTDRGILAIWYPSGLDPKSILTAEYVQTLGEQHLGMKTAAYRSGYEYLILAAKDPSTRLPSPRDIDAFLTAPNDSSGLPAVTDRFALAQPFFVQSDPHFKPITDDQPFLAGNVRHIFSMEQVYQLFAIVGSILGVAGVSILLVLRKSGDPRIPGRSYWQVAALSALIGANFILFEHYVILALFQKVYMFQDALLLGAISFLVISGLGSVLIGPRARVWLQAAAILLTLPLVFFERDLSAGMIVALVAPVAFVTGSFFPALFDLAARNPLAVFAMDAVGAALGSMASFFIPIAFGFSVFFPVAAAVFFVTCLATWRFTRGLESETAERG